MTGQDFRAALVIAARILRERIRDRSAILFAIVTPLGLAVAFSTLIPNDFTSFHTTFVVVDQDHGTAARALVDDALGSLRAAGVADVSEAASEADALATLRAGDAGAVIVIPSGFTAAIGSLQPTQVRVLGGQFPVSLEVARGVVAAYASRVGALQLMVATTTAAGIPAPPPGAPAATPDPAVLGRALAAIREPDPIVTVADPTPLRQAGLPTFYGAAMAIMFVFFATEYGALAIHAERQGGTLPRLLAAPIRPAAILLGTAGAGLLLGIVAMTILVAATTVLVHASWGQPLAVAALVVSAVVAATGISMIVATFARTPQQAGGLNAIVAISLSAIGGVFIPLSQAPASLATISLITPHAWFLRAIDTLSDPSAGIPDILPSIAVLLAMGIVLGGIGLVRARRSLTL